MMMYYVESIGEEWFYVYLFGIVIFVVFLIVEEKENAVNYCKVY